MIKVAIDPYLNPKNKEEYTMVHLQFSNEYRSLLNLLKKAGYLKHESIPLKETYTICFKTAAEPSGKDWELRVIAGGMTLETERSGVLKLTQHGTELNDYITTLRINHKSPTIDAVYTHIRNMKKYIVEIDNYSTLTARRNKLKYGNRQVFSNITRKKQELSL